MPTLNAQQINGVVRTSEPVWSNLERLAEASTAWFTYNTHEGLYSWTINAAGNSVASITEADIIGPIQISGSGLTNLYNAIEIEYPRNDMNDQPHYATLNLPDNLRNAYEPDNTLQVSSEFINNQPQAEHYAMITLKQSRLDLTVTIVMDYSKINLQAGNIIDITSDTYGWTAKEFRIMRVREIEGDDGSLRLEFSCTEYDDTIYDGTWDNFLVAGPPGIRSISSIGTPGTPTITLKTVDSLPAQVVSTTVPAGVVDRVQFWAGNVTITGNVANTNYNLIGTQASTDANAFATGNTVVFTTTGLRDGTWSWKTRGVNGEGTGPFSNVSANVTYSRNQAPDVIKIDTPVVNSAGTTVGGNTIVSGQFAFVNSPADTLIYSGNSVYKGMIFTADAYMAGIGNVVGNVSGVIAPAANCIVELSHNTTALADTRTSLSIKAGVAVYYATAPWNQTTYNSSGFAGLSWSSWNLIGASLDDSSSLTGNLRISTSTNAVLNLSNSTGNIIAFGVSSTLIPASWSNIIPSIGNSGVPQINYTKSFSGNTVIFDAGPDTYQIPGITAGNSLINGQADSWLNYRFFT